MGARTLTLPGRLDATAAAPLRETLMSLRGAALDLRADQVERIGTPPLQVLLSAAATWRADGCRLRLTDPSEALDEAVRTLGLALDDLTAEGPTG
ncbi:MAG TPA: STAS domain-containing protein [Paracoccus sp. (in: a-proteobacteria)]|nr:STAS domain-containing protein [Paracoccus sp. (in: a-proteobacteria)]